MNSSILQNSAIFLIISLIYLNSTGFINSPKLYLNNSLFKYNCGQDTSKRTLDSVYAYRQIEKIDDRNYFITIKVYSSYSGYAKVSEELPNFCKAKLVDCAGCEFKVSGQKISFLWNELKKNSLIIIKYSVSSGNLGDKIKIGLLKGWFSFLLNEKTYSMPIENRK